jgi:hypothetical protein
MHYAWIIWQLLKLKRVIETRISHPLPQAGNWKDLQLPIVIQQGSIWSQGITERADRHSWNRRFITAQRQFNITLD